MKKKMRIYEFVIFGSLYKACGLILGAVAGVIDIGASWLSDVKEGVCRDAFWLNKEQCCWSANDTTLDYDRCKQVPYFFDYKTEFFFLPKQSQRSRSVL